MSEQLNYSASLQVFANNRDDRDEKIDKALPADWDAALAGLEVGAAEATPVTDPDQDEPAPTSTQPPAEALDDPVKLEILRSRTELIRQHGIKRFGRDIRPARAGPIRIPPTNNFGIVDDLDLLLAPGCYGMSGCYREGTAECSACPFASSCRPLAEDQAAMLRTKSVRNSYQEQGQKRQAKHRAALGAKPHSQSASRTKPWDAVGMSRASWYRAGKPSHPDRS